MDRCHSQGHQGFCDIYYSSNIFLSTLKGEPLVETAVVQKVEETIAAFTKEIKKEVIHPFYIH